MLIIYRRSILFKIGGAFAIYNLVHYGKFLSRMMLLTGIQPNLLKSWTGLSETLATKINLAHRFCILINEVDFRFWYFPIQYSSTQIMV